MMRWMLCLLLVAAMPLWAAEPPPELEVYFSPKGGCEEAIVAAIDKAKNAIRVQAYSFTNKQIAAALVRAHKRGVACEVILDKSQRTERYSAADFLANQGVRTLIDDNHAIAHNKVILLDDDTVITGSFNFTTAAEERNAENVLIIKSKPLAAKYLANWQAHEKHSERYQRRPAATK